MPFNELAFRDIWDTRGSQAAAIAAFGISLVTTYVLTESVVATLLANGIAAIVLLLIFAQAREQEIDVDEIASWLVDVSVPSRRGVLLAVGVLLCSFAIRAAVGIVKAVLAPEAPIAAHSVTSTPPASQSAPTVIGLALAVVIIAPFVEELVFRGVLQRFLAEYAGVAAAIVLVSVAFAALHIPNYGGFDTAAAALAIPMAVIFADSVLWGWAYHRTGNAAVSWLAHSGSNAVALTMWLS